MRYEKSQLSLFMILAVLLLFGFLFIHLFSSISKNSNNPLAQTNPERMFVDSCLQQVSQRAMFLLGLNNGIVQNEYAEIDEYKINYAAFQNKSKTLTINEMETQLEDYVDENLKECLYRFDNKTSILLKANNIQTSVRINRLDVSIDVNADIQFRKGKEINKIKSFNTKLPVRLSKVQKLVEYVAVNSPYRIELYDYLGEQNLNVSVYNIENETIYAIIDEKSRIADKPYKYMFAIG